MACSPRGRTHRTAGWSAWRRVSAAPTPAQGAWPRTRRAWLAAAGIALFAYGCVAPVLVRWQVPGLLAQIGAVAIAATLALPFTILYGQRRTRDYGLAKPGRPLVFALCCAVSVVIVQLFVRASATPVPVAGSLPWTIAAAAIAATGAFQYARESRDEVLGRVLKAATPGDAEELAEQCRTALHDPALEGEERAAVALSLAGALIALSGRADHDDALTEAFALLDEVVSSSTPALAFAAAAQVAEAMRVKLERSGDGVGYDRALETLMQAAEAAAPDVPDALGRAFAARGAKFTQLAALESRPDEAERLRSQAVDALEQAVALTPEHMDAHAVHTAALAKAMAAHPLRGDLNSAIRSCRAAVRRLQRADAADRGAAMLVLADLLEMRAVMEPNGGLGGALDRLWPNRPRHGIVAALWPERAGNDLARALFLCMRLSLGGEHAPEARARLPRLREQLIEVEAPSLPGVFKRHTGWMYSHVVAEQSAISGSVAADAAARWAEWATTSGDSRQAAEAWWCWITAVAADLRRRVLHDKQHRISNIQGIVAEAGRALVRAGRLGDAAVALDMGRAVVLTERMHREREGLEGRLTAAGHDGLARRWRAAAELIQRTDREQSQGGPDIQSDQASVASTEYLALVEHEQLLREISRMPGFEDVDAAPDLADLRAAAEEGPIVYLAAAEEGGYGVIVESEGEPARVELPALTRAVAEQHVADLHAADAAHDLAAAMRELLPKLWSAAVGPLVEQLPTGSLVTLIPAGPLAELPLHMAGVARDDDGVWRDRTGAIVFRYAPNARVLLRAQAAARQVAAGGLSVLTAGVPEVSGYRRLRQAGTESENVAAAFAPARAQRPDPATVAAVTRHLDDCAVWHFACHGMHDPASPLDSRLELADGPLTLRAMFARPRLTRRLAVLSACQTSTIDGRLPDEVVGFPSAMLQAGVAGVVACQADVDDHAAMLLVLAFFARFRSSGAVPARALADAQAWLRSATNEDIEEAFPELHTPPADELGNLPRWRGHRPFAEPDSWAVFTYTGA